MGTKIDLTKLKSEFALLKPYTGNTLQIKPLITLYLKELSRDTMLDITIIQIDLFPSIVTLGEFLQDAAQLFLYCCIDIREQVFQFSFALGN